MFLTVYFHRRPRLLFKSSGHTLMVEFLLAELLRSPSTSEKTECREAICLCAGWALGMVLLSRSNSEYRQTTCLSEESDNVKHNRGAYNLGVEDRLNQLIEGGSRSKSFSLFSGSAPSIDVNASSSRMLECSEVNINVTSPAACIALGLMYIRSNNKVIASRLAIPQTVFSLDHIRPDLLIFRAAAYCLVNWDETVASPSDDWLMDRIPSVVKEVLSLSESTISTNKDSSCIQLGQRAALQVYLSLIAGFCWGTALVFAGTRDQQAKGTIISQLKLLQKIRNRNHRPPNRNLVADMATKPLVCKNHFEFIMLLSLSHLTVI